MTLLEIVMQCLEQEKFTWTLTPDDKGLGFEFGGEHGQWGCLVLTEEDFGEVVVYSICHDKVPEAHYAAALDYLNRANFGLSQGNFELDPDDGEVRFRTGIDVEGDRLTPALVKPLIYGNLVMMDRYIRGLQAIIAGTSAPADAIARMEADA